MSEHSKKDVSEIEARTTHIYTYTHVGVYMYILSLNLKTVLIVASESRACITNLFKAAQVTHHMLIKQINCNKIQMTKTPSETRVCITH